MTARQRNIKKAAAAAKRKRTIAHLPKKTRTALGKQGAKVAKLNDQHAFMTIPAGVELHVGDRVACGIIHPCTAFDKWRLIPLVDDGYRVIDAILTYF